jgi:hypothetical protein
MRPALLLLTSLVVAACSRDKAGNASASAYTNPDSSAREDSIAAATGGSELEAPRLIPATQNQLTLMANGTRLPNPDNLMAYRNMAGDLINSMITDLYRAGYADSGNFRALGDSVLADLGGDGASGRLDHARLPQHVDRMQRLIRLYQLTMRQAADRQ